MRTFVQSAAILLLLASGGPAWAQAQSPSQSPDQSPAQSEAQPSPGGQSRPADQKPASSHSIAKIREYCAEWAETDFSKVEKPFLAGYCLGLVQAFRDGVALGTASTLAFIKQDLEEGRKDKRASYNRWCHPTGVPNQFLIGAFMDWSSRHPKHWHLPYSVGFYEAFREEWPCEEDNVHVETQPPADPGKTDNRN
jgi:hypothetical protein